MVCGMLTRYFWELSRSGRSVGEADLAVLLLPMLVSVMVFYPLWTLVSGATKNFFAIVAPSRTASSGRRSSRASALFRALPGSEVGRPAVRSYRFSDFRYSRKGPPRSSA